jgi:hypothetical protein
LNAISKMCADEICSRFSQKKVTKEELANLLFSLENDNGHFPPLTTVAQAILYTLYPKEKK